MGLSVKQEVVEAAAFFRVLSSGEHEVAIDFQCGYIMEPDLDLHKFQSVDKSPANCGRYRDPVLNISPLRGPAARLCLAGPVGPGR